MSGSVLARPRVRTALVAAILFLGTVLLFSRAVRQGFVNYDDPSYVTANPQVVGGLSMDHLRWAFTSPGDYWHPLTWLSHQLDWQLFGSAPAGHHATSVLLHAANAVLAFLLLRRLTGSLGWSAVAAAFFAWHPLRVESVAWVAERKDVLCGFFFLLTLLAYARYATRREARQPAAAAYLSCVGACAAGLLSKAMLVSVPLILIVLDFWPLRRHERARRLLLEKVPFVLLAVAVAAITVVAQRGQRSFVLNLPLGARLANAIVSVPRYAGKLVWPERLIACYPHPWHWPLAAVAAAAAFVVAITIATWRVRHRWPSLLAGWCWWLAMLLPVLGIVQVGFQSIADRYSYLPSLGLELALVGVLARGVLGPPGRWALAGAIVPLLAALTALTWVQEGYWRDSITLFSHAVACSEHNAFAEDFLSSAYVADGRSDEAAAWARRAHADNPHFANPLIVLGSLAAQRGATAEAIDDYQQALAVRPDVPAVRMDLGLLQLGRGEIDEARTMLVAGLAEDPRLRPRTVELGRAALSIRDARSARVLFEAALTVADDADVHVGLGTALMMLGDRAAGLAQWRRAFALDPSYPGLREQLQQTGR